MTLFESVWVAVYRTGVAQFVTSGIVKYRLPRLPNFSLHCHHEDFASSKQPSTFNTKTGNNTRVGFLPMCLIAL
jgi:hypothetical protein